MGGLWKGLLGGFSLRKVPKGLPGTPEGLELKHSTCGFIAEDFTPLVEAPKPVLPHLQVHHPE